MSAIVTLLVSTTTAIAIASTAKPAASRGVAAAVQTVKRDQQVLRFFANHAWLLEDPHFADEARHQVASHMRSLAAAQRLIAAHRARKHRKTKRDFRRLAAAHTRTPAATICRVFGSYCGQALQVARCESGLHTDAANGQYLGLFQMGYQARRLFGHGDSAEEQSRAAHRYFVVSGRDWSPWSCRPW